MANLDLTRAEQRIVEALCEHGETNQQIADRLGYTDHTIRFHLRNARIKSGTRTRAALVLWWIRTGRYEL